MSNPTTATTSIGYAFASDNCAGMCPEAWQLLAEANTSPYAPSYGTDPWTKRAEERIAEFFGRDCQVFLTFNGTAANSLALSALVRPYQSVLCHRHSHIQTDECGCPEMITGGSKLQAVEGAAGKLDLRSAAELARYERGVHFPPARALSVTQATELGTLYSVAQMQQIGEFCRHHQLHFHVDGARFANAVAALGCEPSDLSWKCGVDCISLGGTKNGMAVGECVVFFNDALAHEFAFRVKQGGQLASKMRFLAAPWVGMLESGAFLRRAADANRAAAKLASSLQQIPGVTLEHPVEANAVFVRFPPGVVRHLHDIGWHFYDLLGTGHSRLMASWATTEEQINAFCHDVRESMAKHAGAD